MSGRQVALSVLACTAIAVMLLLLRERSSADPRHHERLTAEILSLSELDARIDESVLKTRFGFSNHYDDLVEHVRRVEAVSAGLVTESGRAASEHREVLSEKIERVYDVFRRKADLVEVFKSRNSLLLNSLRVFPVVVEEALSAGGAARDGGSPVDRLVVQMIRSTLQSGEHPRADMVALVDGLRRRHETAGPESSRLLMHAERLTSSLSTTEEIIEEILELPTGARIVEFEETALEVHSGLVLSAARHRRLLYGLSLTLFVYGLALGVRLYCASVALRDTNANLERRIEKRTAELSERNGALSREIDERERAEAELMRKNRELDEFSYVASHDLQEPLRKLISFSSMLKEDLGDDLPEAAAEDVHYITDAALRMQTLVQDLLTLSRAGKKDLADDPVPLDDCVDGALLALETRLREATAVVRRVTPLPTVRGDATLLTQLFQNLIGNAVKFHREGTPPEVEIGCDGDDGAPVIYVADNGIGIEPKYQEQIFAPFKRLHGRTEYEGTGIGLSICAKAIARHDGRLWVESEPGGGTTFRFTLPRVEGEAAIPEARTEAGRPTPVA